MQSSWPAIHLPRSLADQTLFRLRALLRPAGLLCLQRIKSSRGIAEYTIDSWAGDPLCSMLFTCYEEAEIERRLADAGFDRIERVELPESAVYDKIPRLVERGITGFLIFASRAD